MQEGLNSGDKVIALAAAATTAAIVAGAVTGGGLTVIANAPNPAGVALLRGGFANGAVGMLGLLSGALVPTAIAAAFLFFL